VVGGTTLSGSAGTVMSFSGGITAGVPPRIGGTSIEGPAFKGGAIREGSLTPFSIIGSFGSFGVFSVFGGVGCESGRVVLGDEVFGNVNGGGVRAGTDTGGTVGFFVSPMDGRTLDFFSSPMDGRVVGFFSSPMDGRVVGGTS
jgi:hypothetical protein